MSDIAVAALAVVGILFGSGGALTIYIQKRGERPSGWQVAVKGLEAQVDDLKVRIGHAEARAQAAESRADEVVVENHGLKNTIALQTRALDAKDGRIVQLLTSWPNGSRPPKPHPEHEPYL